MKLYLLLLIIYCLSFSEKAIATITITGSKASGTLTSVGTTTITDTGATFNSSDYDDQRIIGLWDSTGATHKGLAWVRSYVSGTQLELESEFFDKDGNTVTQTIGDTYQVSKNFADEAQAGLAVSRLWY